jgi:hypothetical protein
MTRRILMVMGLALASAGCQNTCPGPADPRQYPSWVEYQAADKAACDCVGGVHSCYNLECHCATGGGGVWW